MQVKEVIVKSPCQFIYTMKNVMDNLGETQLEPIKINVKVPVKNIHIKNFADRYARDIYMYYRIAKYIEEDNSYLCYTNYDKVPYPSTFIRIEDEYIVAELVTFKSVDDESLTL